MTVNQGVRSSVAAPAAAQNPAHMSVAGAPSSAAAPSPAEWHALDAGEALCRAGTDPQSGLDARTVALRLAEHGPNALPETLLRPGALPFDSDSKLMATRHRRAGAPRCVTIKGAPEAVLHLARGQEQAMLAAARATAVPRLLRNRWLAGGLALSIALQAAVLYAAPMNALFHTVPLPLSSLLPLMLLASTVLWAEELRQLVVRTLRRPG